MNEEGRLKSYLSTWKDEYSKIDVSHLPDEVLYRMAEDGGMEKADPEAFDHLSLCPVCMEKYAGWREAISVVTEEDEGADPVMSYGLLKAAVKPEEKQVEKPKQATPLPAKPEKEQVAQPEQETLSPEKPEKKQIAKPKQQTPPPEKPKADKVPQSEQTSAPKPEPVQPPVEIHFSGETPFTQNLARRITGMLASHFTEKGGTPSEKIRVSGVVAMVRIAEGIEGGGGGLRSEMTLKMKDLELEIRGKAVSLPPLLVRVSGDGPAGALVPKAARELFRELKTAIRNERAVMENLWDAPQFISLYRQEVDIDFVLRFFHHQ